ncbi:MAG: class I SAM-dependent methyltransferase [Parvibaculaceae bacterium]
MTTDTDALVATFLDTWSQMSPEPFLERYGAVEEEVWEDRLRASITQPVQDGLTFPLMPPVAVQERINGHAGETAMNEAMRFYRVTLAYCQRLEFDVTRNRTLLDFGTGWGRTIRPFMNRIELRNLHAYDAMPMFCQMARLLNPYITVTSGPDVPPTIYDYRQFDMVVAYSVLTHLPPNLARSWFEEFARILKPGGLLIITTWGARFLETLVKEEQRMKAGQEIHWFHKQVIEAAGKLDDIALAHKGGQIVFIPSSVNPNYGDTLMSPKAARGLSVNGLELAAYDDSALPQDLFVFRRV